MGFVESLRSIIYDILHNLDRIHVDLIKSNGLNPLRIRHDSGGLIEFRNDGKVYYNNAEIGTGGGGVTDHGALTGLADDDHAQYLLVSGGRALQGNLSMNNYDIGNVNTVNGRVDTALSITANYGNLNLNSAAGSEVVIGDPVSMSAKNITDLGAPVVGTDAATKTYVDNTSTSHMQTDPLWDVAGDIAYATGADTGTILSLGNSSQILVVNSGATAPEWTGSIVVTKVVTGDHGTAATDEVVNVCYGTSATPPTASTTTEGALYIQYTA